MSESPQPSGCRKIVGKPRSEHWTENPAWKLHARARARVLPLGVPLELRFYNQRRDASPFVGFLFRRSLKLSAARIFIQIRHVLAAWMPTAPFRAGDTSTGRLPISIIDTPTDIQLHPARNDSCSRFSRGLLLLARTIFPVIPRRFLNIRF